MVIKVEEKLKETKNVKNDNISEKHILRRERNAMYNETILPK